MGAFLTLTSLSVCLLVESIMLIIAFAKDRAEYNGKYDRAYFTGSCAVTKRLKLLIALFINAVATITIASSNYIMQCLSVPSASEVRRAHRNGRSLQIGVSSPSNLFYMSQSKATLWCIMGLTSVPVHLFLNSAFHPTWQQNEYLITIMTADYANESLWSACTTTHYLEPGYVCDMYTNATSSNYFERISNAECMERYSGTMNYQYSDLILVSTWNSSTRLNAIPSNFSKRCDPGPSYPSSNMNSSCFIRFEGLFYITHAGESFRSSQGLSHKLCDHDRPYLCLEAAAKANSSNWLVTEYEIPIDHCLSHPTQNQFCQLRYNPIILSMAVFCDVVKIIVVFLPCVLKNSHLLLWETFWRVLSRPQRHVPTQEI